MEYTRFYLETNALRQLNSKLELLKDNYFTSGLSILELISGIDGKEYQLRSTVIKKILTSKIPIVWELPESIQANAFPIIEFTDFRIAGLKEICKIIVDYEDKTEVLKHINSLKYDVKYFSDLDDSYSKKFIDATKKGNEDLKKELNDSLKEPLGLGNVKHSVAKEFVKNLPNDTYLNESITLYAIVESLGDGIDFEHPDNPIDRGELFDSYNGDINIFIRAFSKFTATKGATGSIPGKNDFVDLHHLLYLGNKKDCAIVSDDKMIQEINEQTIGVDDFRNLHLTGAKNP